MRINSDANEIINVCNWLNAFLNTNQVDASMAFQLETVVCEVLNNVITHAYANTTENNYIDLHLRIIKRRIILTIDDFGDGFQEPTQIDQADQYAEQGRGRLIIQAWTDNFRYWSFPEMNRHCLVKYF